MVFVSVALFVGAYKRIVVKIKSLSLLLIFLMKLFAIKIFDTFGGYS